MADISWRGEGRTYRILENQGRPLRTRRPEQPSRSSACADNLRPKRVACFNCPIPRSDFLRPRDRKFAELYFRSWTNPYLSNLSEPQNNNRCGPGSSALGALGKAWAAPPSLTALLVGELDIWLVRPREQTLRLLPATTQFSFSILHSR